MPLLPAVIAIVGASNSGKTTLIEKLLPVLRSRGHRVGTIKHDAHGFEIDRPGKDTWRHREAGAETVVITGPGKLALIKSLDAPPTPDALVRDYFLDKDLVLVEGFKQFSFPRIEVVRAANSDRPLVPAPELAGLVTDLALDLAPGLKRFGLEEITAIADHIEALMPYARLES